VEVTLEGVLERSRSLGFLGPGPAQDHLEHARSFSRAWHEISAVPPAAFLDLGSGGGVPGLVLAVGWQGTPCVLLDAMGRRCDFLAWAVEELGISGWVTVRCARAEDAAREADLESRFELVTARSFAAPAPTAECAARFLAPGAVILVSEPPDPAETAARWPEAGLAELGLGPASHVSSGRNLVAIRRTSPCPSRFPRRVGVPAKRPLF
jgi:16S rRNA (guanine527-N7)-methyltransferase